MGRSRLFSLAETVMLFRVGAYKYRLRITEGAIVLDDGRIVNGLADRERMQILIAGDVKPEARIRVLLHELKHCWAFHVPPAMTEEQDAELYAIISAQMMEDLTAMGGPEALEQLRPPRPFEPENPVAVKRGIGGEGAEQPDMEPRELTYVEDVECQAVPDGDRAQCGVCGLTVAGGQIVTHRTVYDGQVSGRICRRSLFCPHCEHVQSWTEGVDPQGRPNGAVVAGPFYETGEKMDAFLRQHGEAVGVIVV